MRTEPLRKYIQEVSRRNKNLAEIEVFSLTNSEGFIKSTDYFTKEVFSKDLSNYKIVAKSQFAYNPSRINVGSIDYLKYDNDVIISPLYVVFECDSELNPEYLKLFLKSPLGNARIRANTKGAVRDNLSYKSISKIKIPVFSISEQLQITSLLTKTAGLITHRINSISLLEEYLKSIYFEMFGDPVKNEMGWEKIRFKNVAKNENSKRIPVKQVDRDNREGIYPYYGATGVIDTIDDFKFNGKYLLIAEDGKNLLYRRKNNAFIATGKFWVNNHAHVLSENGACTLKYLEFFLNNIDFKPYISGIDQVKLNKTNLDKIPVPHPPMELQLQFTKIVETSESLKVQYQKSLQELENLYGSLSQKAFNGELSLI